MKSQKPTTKKCCICGEKFEGWGNNPYPVKDSGQCCDKCNRDKVIPARIAQISCKKS